MLPASNVVINKNRNRLGILDRPLLSCYVSVLNGTIMTPGYMFLHVPSGGNATVGMT